MLLMALFLLLNNKFNILMALGGCIVSTIFFFCHKKGLYWEIARTLFIAILPAYTFVLWLQYSVIDIFEVRSNSMEPALKSSDKVVVCRFMSSLRFPGLFHSELVRIPMHKIFLEYNDIIVLHPPDRPREIYVKRLIGLPHDEISATGNEAMIHGRKVSELTKKIQGLQSYQKMSPLKGKQSQETRYRIPENHYYVLGDNIHSSRDSRDWGPVPGQSILGKVCRVW